MSDTKIHTGGECSVNEDFLWNNYRILVVYLPPRSPKYNPVTKIWKEVTHDLDRTRLNPYRSHDITHATAYILDKFSHREMIDFMLIVMPSVGCKLTDSYSAVWNGTYTVTKEEDSRCSPNQTFSNL